MKINRQNLLDKLERVSYGLSSRNVIEQSECFVFSKKRIITFNDELFCSCVLDMDIEGAVRSKLLMGLLGKMVEEEIDIVVKGDKLVLKGNQKQAEIVLEKDIVLSIGEIEKPDSWETLPEKFVEICKMVGSCVSSDESKFTLTCVHMMPEYIEAGNDFQIIRYFVSSGIDNLLVGGSSLLSICSTQPTKYSVTNNLIHFKTDKKVQISCRNNRDEFPNLDDYLKVKGKKVKVSKSVVEAAGRAGIFSSDMKDDGFVEVFLSDGKMKLRGQNSGGIYTEELKAEYEGNPIKFLVKPQLLGDLFQKSNEWIVSDKLQVRTKDFVFCTSITRDQM